MSKMKCEVVRDLMPLVADEVASEESKRLVGEHLKDCRDCKQVYEIMTREVPKPREYADSETKFIRFCKRLQKRMKLKNLLALLLAAIVIAYGAWATYHNVYTDKQEMPTSWVSMSLEQNEEGRVIQTFTMKDGHFYAYAGYTDYYDHGILYVAPDKYVWQIGWYEDKRTEFHNAVELEIRSGKLYLIEGYERDRIYDKEADQYVETMIPTRKLVKELRLGSEKDYVTVWKEGDEIPMMERQPEPNEEM